MKTIKEKIDEACGAAWAALMKSLSDNGVKFDDCDSACYVDDAEQRKTYAINVSLTECDEYGGDQ